MRTSAAGPAYGPDELDDALLQMERRALGRNRVPLVDLPLARALERHARLRAREAAQRMAKTAEAKRLVLQALSDRNVPAEVYIASIRAKHGYGLAARGVEAAKSRAGMAFRVLQRAVYHSASSASIAAQDAALKATLSNGSARVPEWQNCIH